MAAKNDRNLLYPYFPDMKHIESQLAHTGTEADPASGGLAPAIHTATNYEADADGQFSKGYLYGRKENPTRYRLQSALAKLEGGETCLAFSSGMAAATAVLQALAPEDEVCFSDALYVGVRSYAERHFQRWGGRIRTFNPTENGSLEDALSERTRLVWIETPSNPELTIVDIARTADAAHDVGALLVCDSTFSTPLLTRPLEHGADIVMHSVTKFLSGHSDVLGGVLVMRAGLHLHETISSFHELGGAVMDPFSAWLTMRGMRSLGARMRMICSTATTVAEWAESHPAIRSVLYPGLESHPGHAIAAHQMSAFGGIVTLRVADGETAARTAYGRVRIFRRATSLGGTESLIDHRRTSEGPDSTSPPDLLRLSIGLEHPDDLIADLENAFRS